MSPYRADRALPSFEDVLACAPMAHSPLIYPSLRLQASGCLDVAGGDLLLERFVAIVFLKNWEKSDSTHVLPPICLVTRLPNSCLLRRLV